MSPKQCPGGRRSASSGAFLLWGQSRGSGVEVRSTRLAGDPDGVDQKVCPIGIDWKEQLRSIFSVLGLLAKIPPNRPSGRRRFCAVNSEPPRAAENCAGATLPAPSIQIPKGGDRLRRPEPKTKGRPYGCPFVLEGTVKIDIFSFGFMNRKTTQPAFWPAARVRRTSVFTTGENLGGRAALPP